MRGSTRRRGSSWTAYWAVQRHNAETGSLDRVQRSKGGFGRQKDAQAFLNEQLSGLDAGTYVEPSRQPLATFMADEWLPAIAGTVRPLTLARYRQNVRLYIAGRDIGGVPLRALNAGHLNGLYAEMERDGLSVGTRRLLHAVVHRALRDAVKWGKLPRNVATAADPPSVARTRVQAWTAGELRRFLAHVQDDRLYGFWRLAAATGARRGELLGLTWQLLDLDGARMRVEQQLRCDPGECDVCGERHACSMGPPKSRRGERTIALDPDTVAALRHHRDVQLLERDLAGPAYRDHDLVFADELGRPYYPESISGWFVRRRKAAGITAGSLHCLRHTHATIALTEGVALHVVAGRLGDDPKTLLDTYAHLLPRSDEQAAAVVAAVLSVDRPLTTPVAPVA
jgi:integrase